MSRTRLARLTGADGAEMAHLYVVEKWSLSQLAADFHCHLCTVRWWLLRQGVELRPRGTDPADTQPTGAQVAEMKRLARRGEGPLRIARRLGLTVDAVRHQMRKHRIRRRPRVQPQRQSSYCKPTPAQEAEVLCRYQSDGQTTLEIVEATGLTQYAVRKILQKGGVDLRNTGPRAKLF